MVASITGGEKKSLKALSEGLRQKGQGDKGGKAQATVQDFIQTHKAQDKGEEHIEIEADTD